MENSSKNDGMNLGKDRIAWTEEYKPAKGNKLNRRKAIENEED